MGLSNKQNSNYGILAKSIETVVPDDELDTVIANGGAELDVLKGRMQTWELTPGHSLRRPDANGVWRPQEVECWEVVEVEGFGEPEDSFTVALNLLNGNTEAQWNREVLKNPVVSADVELKRKIRDRKFIPEAIQRGLLIKGDDGIYTVIGSDEDDSF
jgi:hypothetical protein